MKGILAIIQTVIASLGLRMERNISDNTNTSNSEDLFLFPSSLSTFFIILYGVTSMVAVTGNLLVIYVVIFRKMKTVTNMFIANLALADVIIGLFAIPFQFQVCFKNI